MSKSKKATNTLLQYHDSSPSIVEIGVDEVGRGPLFGRVYTAAVILPKESEDGENTFDHSKMKDSKKFHSKKKLIETAEYIKENAIAWSVSYEDERVIDEINILQATQRSMHTCITQLIKQHAQEYQYIKLLIDGNYFKPLVLYNPIKQMLEPIDFVCVEGGDNKYSTIAAASILAKVARDTYIEELCVEHPTLSEYYNIDSNKGYGAKKHIEGIKEYGITQWHRKSFGICKTFV